MFNEQINMINLGGYYRVRVQGSVVIWHSLGSKSSKFSWCELIFTILHQIERKSKGKIRCTPKCSQIHVWSSLCALICNSQETPLVSMFQSEGAFLGSPEGSACSDTSSLSLSCRFFPSLPTHRVRSGFPTSMLERVRDCLQVRYVVK